MVIGFKEFMHLMHGRGKGLKISDSRFKIQDSRFNISEPVPKSGIQSLGFLY